MARGDYHGGTCRLVSVGWACCCGGNVGTLLRRTVEMVRDGTHARIAERLTGLALAAGVCGCHSNGGRASQVARRVDAPESEASSLGEISTHTPRRNPGSEGGEAPARPSPAVGPEPAPETRTTLAQNIATYAPPEGECRPGKPRNPFAEIEFDRVVAHSYPDPRAARWGSVDRTSGVRRLHGRDLAEAELTPAQAGALVRLLGDESAYGGSQAACFDPHHSLIFYRRDEIVGFVDLCFECNVLEASPHIATKHIHDRLEVQDDGESLCLPSWGFSPLGWQRWKQLCETWGVGRCPKEVQWWGHEDDE